MIQKAYNIAKRDLRACYAEQGIYAGLKHFTDYWARDSLFACFGSLELGDYDIVKKTLNLFIKYQHKNGQIPLRVGDYFIAWKIFGFKPKTKIRARYDQDKFFSHPTDQNSLFIIVFEKYIRKTKDYKFLRNNINSLRKAIQWNLSNDKDKDYLMEDKNYSTWADSLKKKGKVLYTNVLHCEALKRYSNLCKILKIKEATQYADLSKEVNNKINRTFWNGNYYIDWIEKKPYNYFSTDGNVLAIHFGIADKEKAKKIQQSIKKFGINKGMPSKTNHPKYPSSKVSIINKSIGLGDYHNGIRWIWLGCIDAIAKHKTGMKKEARELLNKISQIIVKYNGVYEVYEPNAMPVNRHIYKSEQPFSWNSGLFIYAVKKVGLR